MMTSEEYIEELRRNGVMLVKTDGSLMEIPSGFLELAEYSTPVERPRPTKLNTCIAENEWPFDAESYYSTIFMLFVRERI